MSKLKTLIHNGIYIPSYNWIGLSIKFKDKWFPLSPLAEQLAIQFVRKFDTPYIKDQRFVFNFLIDLLDEIDPCPPDKDRATPELKDFDFSDIEEYLDRVKTLTETMNKEEKKLATKLKKDLREKLKEKYGYALVNGTKIPIMNWSAEPNSIYLSKGTNILRGHWKIGPKREEIILNLSEKPKELENGWKEIIWDKNSMYTAKWIDKLTGREKYVWLSPISKIRQAKEQRKFLLASELEKKLHLLEQYLDKELKNKDIELRRLATVVYLIKETGIRVGDEKLKGETGNIGATTLEGQHLSFEGKTLILNFRGKDFVQWSRTFEISDQVLKNLKEFKKGDSELLFPKIDSNKISKFLRKVIPKLSAKIFRTYIAGTIWKQHSIQNLELIDENTSLPVKKCLFKLTNLEVAKKLNHKKALSKNHAENLAKKKAQLEEERKKLETLPGNNPKYLKQISKIEKLSCDCKLLEETADWNLSTSLTSYINPQLCKEWLDKVSLEAKEVYSKSLLQKFSWCFGEDNSEKERDP